MLKYFPTIASLLAPRRTSPRQRRALLRLIAVAAEQRLELPPLLQAWAEEEWGAQSIRLQKLAVALHEGTPLANAIERFPGLLSDEQILMVRSASESGTLGQTLRRELEVVAGTASRGNDSTRLIANYGVFFLLIGAPVALFLQTAIMPQMKQIYNDFEIDLPASMHLAMGTAGLAWWAWMLGGLLMLAVLWLRCFPWPASYLRRSVVPRLFGAIRSQRVGSVLNRLGDSAAAGRPLRGAISTLARYHFDPVLRHKLLFARNELELGAELWPALGEAGLLRPAESEALTAADRTGTRAWTLRALGKARHDRCSRRLRLQTGVLMPLVVLALGAFVLIQATGIFTSLIHLIECLT